MIMTTIYYESIDLFFFFKQKTAYEMRISDWSSDVCSSDLAVADDKRDVRLAPRQFLILLLLIYCWLTTLGADFPKEALDKWDWVWKALAFAIFLPLTLRTRLRIEALLAFMIVAASTIIIVGGIKTLASGGGYGEPNLMVHNNRGLSDGSHKIGRASCRERVCQYV